MKHLLLAFLLLPFSAAAELSLDDAGLWYDPGNPGHGITVNTWLDDEGRTVAAIFWYTYAVATGVPEEDGAQVWYLVDNIVSPNDTAVIYRSTGIFPAQSFMLGDPVGIVTLEKEPDGSLSFDVLINDRLNGCNGPQPIAVPACYAEFRFERLSPAS